MKKILFALCMACSFGPAMAQSAAHNARTEARAHKQMSPEEKAKRLADKMQQKLNLTADQHSRILAVNMEVMKRKQTLKAQDTKPDKAAFKAIGAYRREQFAAILSPAQMEQWKAFRAEQKQKHQRKMNMKKQGVQGRANMPLQNQTATE